MVENVSFAENVDFLRCQWVEEAEAGFFGLVMAMRTWNGETVTIRPKLVGLPAGGFEVFVDASWARSVVLKHAEGVQLDVEVGAEEVTSCVLKK